MNWFGKIFSNNQKEQEEQERRLAEEQQREKKQKANYSTKLNQSIRIGNQMVMWGMHIGLRGTDIEEHIFQLHLYRTTKADQMVKNPNATYKDIGLFDYKTTWQLNFLYEKRLNRMNMSYEEYRKHILSDYGLDIGELLSREELFDECCKINKDQAKQFYRSMENG